MQTQTEQTSSMIPAVYRERSLLSFFHRSPFDAHVDLPEAPPPVGLQLGVTVKKKRPLVIGDDKLVQHLAIFGPGGMGLFNMLEHMLFQQICRGGGFLFMDKSLSVVTLERLQYMARLAGREHDFYVLNVEAPTNTNTYNPILEGDADEIAARLMQLVTLPADAEGNRQRAQLFSLLIATIAALKAVNKPYTFQELALLMSLPAAWRALEKEIPLGPAKETFSHCVALFKEDTSFNETLFLERAHPLTSVLARFSMGKIGEVLNSSNPEIRLSEMLAQDKLVYVGLPNLRKDFDANWLGKLIVSDLAAAVEKICARGERLKSKVPFIAALDELGAYSIPGIARLFSRANVSNIALIALQHSLASVEGYGREFAQAIMQCTRQKIFFRTPATIPADAISTYIKSVRPASTITPALMRDLNMGEVLLSSDSRLFHVELPYLKLPDELPAYQARHPLS